MQDFAVPDTPDVFGLRPSPYNYPEGPRRHGEMGKRPLSSTSPAIIETEDGRFILAVGGSGGSRIYGAVAQTLMLLDWGYDLLHAVEEPRVHDQLLPAYVRTPSSLPHDVGNETHRSPPSLECRSTSFRVCRQEGTSASVSPPNAARRSQAHVKVSVTVFDVNMAVAEVQAALLRDDWIYGASDSRKNGRASSY